MSDTPPPLPPDGATPPPFGELPPTPQENPEPAPPDSQEMPDIPPMGEPIGGAEPPPDIPEEPEVATPPAPPASPLPFLVLLLIVAAGGGIWYWFQQREKAGFDAGRQDEAKIEPYKGDLSEDGSEFVGVWKGYDSDEIENTNWEIIRNADYSFTAVYKKYYKEDRTILNLSGEWKVKGAYLQYKVKADFSEGPDLAWPNSWKETIGDIHGDTLELQSLKTPSRRGPLFESRTPKLGYKELKSVEIAEGMLPQAPGETKSPAPEVPGDMEAFLDFNDGTASDLAGKKHKTTAGEVDFLPAKEWTGFETVATFKDVESGIIFSDSDTWDLAKKDFSIALWLRVKGSRASGYGIFDSLSDERDASLTGIGLRTIGTGAPEFHVYHRDAKYRFKGKTKLNTGKWNHVAVTKSGYLGQIYVNGQPEDRVITVYYRSGDETAANLTLGNFLDTGIPKGAIDNFRLYLRQLSPEEVLAIYDSEHVPPSDTPVPLR